ncbi:hypothetical protein PQJ75_25075 [Rhodoplanes sp. TEM]|uniref:Uncharacterized protein n=1 Tax=Rhodoplanes tepidamans TaxID=200616 RepID=A0ABT5JCL8_RHOTP|nr:MULTISPECIES: hypothetical protein [Rhodoplanes]MDC7787009.1 hypothetical protein [Rhodoplanes tepidamans]MDC7987017.1 hypothetical protein [Rhodoplanes sp. TEM]MDQ0354266.1 hypothetical protein [Rhodoplanes tepidamans]
MRTITAIALVLAGVALSAPARADEAATFAARWPDAALREATDFEAARLIATVLRTDLAPVIKARLLARFEPPVQCSIAACELPALR